MHSSMMCTVCCSGCVGGVSSGGVWPGGVHVSAKGVSAHPRRASAWGCLPGRGCLLMGKNDCEQND